MSANRYLARVVTKLDDKQAERALAVLEDSAEWILTGVDPCVAPDTWPGPESRPRTGNHRQAAAAGRSIEGVEGSGEP